MTTEVKPRTEPDAFVRVAAADQVHAAGSTVVHVDGHTIALFSHEGQIRAVDNRCPHMGFPLDRGSVKGCILTCHWHHARFDLRRRRTGGPVVSTGGKPRPHPSTIQPRGPVPARERRRAG